MVDIGHTAIDGPGAVPETLATVATVESQAPIEPEALVSPWASLQTAPWEPHCPTLQDFGSIARRTPNTGYRQGVWRSRNAGRVFHPRRFHPLQTRALESAAGYSLFAMRDTDRPLV